MSHPRRPSPGMSARLLAVLLAVVLAGCGVENQPNPPPATGTAAADALSLRELATLPEVHVPGRLQVVAGTGSRFITLGGAGVGRYSADNGRTWTDLPAELAVRADLQGDGGPSFGSLMGYQGTFAGLVASTDPSGGYLGLQRWNPETGGTTFYPYPMGADQSGAEPLYPVDYVGSALVLSDGRIVRLAGERATPLTPAFAATPRLQGLQTALTRDAATAVQAGYSLTGNYGYLNVAKVDGGSGAKAYRIPGLLSMDVSAFTIHYLVGTAASLSVCKALVATPTKASCRRLAAGDFRRSRYVAKLTTSIGADQVRVARRAGGGVRQWLVREGRVTLVAKADDGWQWLPFRDSEQPMALVASGTNVTTAATIGRNGRPTPLFAAPAAVATATGLALSPGRLSFRQDLFSTSAGTRRAVWTQQFGDTLGQAWRLTSSEVSAITASAARTAVQRDGSTSAGNRPVTFYDGRARTTAVATARSSSLHALSGPYALIGRQVVRADGHRYDTGPVLALFGSLVVEASGGDEAAERTFRVRDLDHADVGPVTLEVPTPAGRLYRDDGWLIWGDWVVAGYAEGGSYDQVAVNRRTGERVEFTRDDRVTALGDGWALVTDGTVLQLRMLSAPHSLTIEGAAPGAVTTDGVRTIAWTDARGTHLAEVVGLPEASVRLLGVLAPSRVTLDGDVWSPQFDLTAPVAAGRLEVRSQSGELVRTLVTTAGAQGSIRGLEWDGTNDTGKRVPPGTYSWTLVVDGVAGGPAVSVDGSGPPSGKVVVTAPAG